MKSLWKESQRKTTVIWNPSGLHPTGHAVLVEMYQPEYERTIIAIPDHVRAQTKMLETRAVVLEVGPNAWKTSTWRLKVFGFEVLSLTSGEPPRAKPGDRVLISKWGGVMVTGTLDGKLYRMVNANDVYCDIDEPEAAIESEFNPEAQPRINSKEAFGG
jgi:co-chaperonin GroES (HSP10)